MRTAASVLLAICSTVSAASPLVAKQRTVKITISGADLKQPIEISDPNILAKFQVWTGPGTSGNDRQGLIIDWSQGPVREIPTVLHKYQVSFYGGSPRNERIVYVVYYVFGSGADPGYVYLPGGSDEWYSVNMHSIFRGVEGKWFRAWSAWEHVARPLIEKGT